MVAHLRDVGGNRVQMDGYPEDRIKDNSNNYPDLENGKTEYQRWIINEKHRPFDVWDLLVTHDLTF